MKVSHDAIAVMANTLPEHYFNVMAEHIRRNQALVDAEINRIWGDQAEAIKAQMLEVHKEFNSLRERAPNNGWLQAQQGKFFVNMIRTAEGKFFENMVRTAEGEFWPITDTEVFNAFDSAQILNGYFTGDLDVSEVLYEAGNIIHCLALRETLR